MSRQKPETDPCALAHRAAEEFAAGGSNWGEWGDGVPLERRPPELWAHQIHDASWDGGE